MSHSISLFLLLSLFNFLPCQAATEPMKRVKTREFVNAVKLKETETLHKWMVSGRLPKNWQRMSVSSRWLSQVIDEDNVPLLKEMVEQYDLPVEYVLKEPINEITLLHRAIIGYKAKAITYLLGKGADVSAGMSFEDTNLRHNVIQWMYLTWIEPSWEGALEIVPMLLHKRVPLEFALGALTVGISVFDFRNGGRHSVKFSSVGHSFPEFNQYETRSSMKIIDLPDKTTKSFDIVLSFHLFSYSTLCDDSRIPYWDKLSIPLYCHAINTMIFQNCIVKKEDKGSDTTAEVPYDPMPTLSRLSAGYMRREATAISVWCADILAPMVSSYIGAGGLMDRLCLLPGFFSDHKLTHRLFFARIYEDLSFLKRDYSRTVPCHSDIDASARDASELKDFIYYPPNEEMALQDHGDTDVFDLDDIYVSSEEMDYIDQCIKEGIYHWARK